MVFGTNALVTKPAQSLAPMITLAIFNAQGYSKNDLPINESDSLSNSMFLVTCSTTAIISIIQFFIWKLYNIRNSHKTLNEILVE